MEIIIQINKQRGVINAYDDRTAKTYSIDEIQNMAFNGDVVAQCAMGDYFSTPEIVDFGKAVVWYKKAAENGNAKAQWLYGSSFFTGMGGVQKDLSQAEYWFKKSAEQGNMEGKYSLAGCYFINGDLINAEYWFSKAAEQGHAEAKMMLKSVSLSLKIRG